jgi:hypothetical protein
LEEAVLCLLNASRALTRLISVTITTGGSVTRTTKAIWGESINMVISVPVIIEISFKNATSTVVKNSSIVCTSLVKRVTILPTG